MQRYHSALPLGLSKNETTTATTCISTNAYRDEDPESDLAILCLFILAAMGKKEKIRLSIMKWTPKVRQKTFGVHFIVVAAVVFLLLYLYHLVLIMTDSGCVYFYECLLFFLLTFHLKAFNHPNIFEGLPIWPMMPMATSMLRLVATIPKNPFLTGSPSSLSHTSHLSLHLLHQLWYQLLYSITQNLTTEIHSLSSRCSWP